MGDTDGISGALRFQRAFSFEPAPAKVNLTLEILGRRDDGYHELQSLVMFADFGDRLSCHAGDAFSLSIEGPFAAALGGGGNLVERAVAAYASAYAAEVEGAYALVKNLPVAAGLGGGSADAAAALRLLMRRHGVPADLAALMPAAREIGADAPCCLYSRAALMTGIGEKLHLLAPLPPIPALLVNPMLPLSTRDVFRELAAKPLTAPMPEAAVPDLTGMADLLSYMRQRRNDLEPPACRLLPVVAEILSALAALPGALVTRLSGSGPTCFALFEDMHDAQSAASVIGGQYPDWWVQSVLLS